MLIFKYFVEKRRKKQNKKNGKKKKEKEGENKYFQSKETGTLYIKNNLNGAALKIC